MGVELAIASLVASTAATGVSMHEQSKARGEQRKQARQVEAQNAAKAAVAKRQSLRAERVRRAQLAAQAEGAGIAGSSTALLGEQRSGGMAAEQASQTAGALSATNALSATSQAIAGHQARSQLFSNISSISSSVFSAAGGFGAIAGGAPTATPTQPSNAVQNAVFGGATKRR